MWTFSTLFATIVPDHKALTWTFYVKDPTSRLLKWRLQLEVYDYTIEYKAGKRNVNVDAVGRNIVVMKVISSKEKQQKILKETHECPIGGHQDVQHNYERLNLYVTWSGMYQGVENYLRIAKLVRKTNFMVLTPRQLFKKLILNYNRGTNFTSI